MMVNTVYVDCLAPLVLVSRAFADTRLVWAHAASLLNTYESMIWNHIAFILDINIAIITYILQNELNMNIQFNI